MKKSSRKPKTEKKSEIFDKSKIRILEQTLGEERVKVDESLKYHLENETPGHATALYIATSFKELETALNLADELKIPYFLVGAGTKMFISDSGLAGFVIKNRTSSIRVSGVKGKVTPTGIGVEEAMVEADSGVSLQKINDFLKEQGLAQMNFPYVPNSTIGGSLYVSMPLQLMTQKIKVWQEREIIDIDVLDLKRTDLVMSVIFKVRSAN